MALGRAHCGSPLIPAKAGIQLVHTELGSVALGPRFRGDERIEHYPETGTTSRAGERTRRLTALAATTACCCA